MGTAASIPNNSQISSGTNTIHDIQAKFQKNVIPLELQVAHYTPSSFPLVPIIDVDTNSLIKNSWDVIIKRDERDTTGVATAGISAFYNDFYERISILDTSGRFEAVLTRNADGVSKLQAKGAILIRIIKFLISIEGDSRDTQYKLYMLGKSHAQKGIRPWQYAIFVQTLLLTLSARLGTGATNEVMEAWVNMLAFVMQSMLPVAIENQVVETEINVNISSEFATEEMQAELKGTEDMLELRHRVRSNAHSPLTSAVNSPRGSKIAFE